MNILWCGGEDTSFPNGATPVIVTTAGTFRSYARCSLASNFNDVSSTTARCIGTTFPGGAITSAWFGFHVRASGGAVTSMLIAGLTHSSKTSGDGLWVGLSSSSLTKIRLVKYDGTTQTELAVESGSSLPTDGIYRITMQVINYGASATVNVWVNNNLAITFAGDVRISSLTSLDRVAFICRSAASGLLASEFIVADANPGALNLVTHYPDGAGDANTWTGAYTDIDEVTINDSDVIYVNSATQDALFTLSDVPAGTYGYVGLKVESRAAKSADASIGTLKLGVKSGGTVDVDAGQALTTSFTTYERYMTTINGGTPSISDINAMQIAHRSAA